MSELDHPPPEALLTAGQEWLRALALRLARDPHRADDLAQDAALALIERPPRSQASAKAWIRRVVTNRARDLFRRETRRTARERAVAHPGWTRPAGEVAAEAEIRARVVSALNALDEPYRTTIRLSFYEQLTLVEIAARLDVPYETARARLHRGLARLRGNLDRDLGSREAWAVPILVDAGSGRARPRPRDRSGRARSFVRAGAILGALALLTWGVAASETRSVAEGRDSGERSEATVVDARIRGLRGRRSRTADGTPPGVPAADGSRNGGTGGTRDEGDRSAATATGTVRGRVSHPEGEMLRNARVHIVGIDEQGRWQRYPAHVGPSGAFVAEQIPVHALRDPVRVEAGADGFLTTVYLAGPTELESLAIELSRSIRLVGRILGADGRPVPGVDVSYWHGVFNEERSTTDAGGRYRLRIPAHWRADFRVIVDRPGSPRERVHFPYFSHHGAEQVELPDVRLHAFGPISGRVVGADGRPRAGVGVRLFSRQRVREVGAVKTDRNGTFTFVQVGRGRHQIEAVWNEGEGPEAREHGCRLLGVRSGAEGLEMIGAAVRRVTVRIFNASDREPLRHPYLMAHFGRGLASTLDADAAWCRLPAGVSQVDLRVMQPGWYDVVIDSQEFEMAWTRGIDLTGPGPVAIDVYMKAFNAPPEPR